jgi:hypothetical protein
MPDDRTMLGLDKETKDKLAVLAKQDFRSLVAQIRYLVDKETAMRSLADAEVCGGNGHEEAQR